MGFVHAAHAQHKPTTQQETVGPTFDIEFFLSHGEKALKTMLFLGNGQQQGKQHRTSRVVVIGHQADRKQRAGKARVPLRLWSSAGQERETEGKTLTLTLGERKKNRAVVFMYIKAFVLAGRFDSIRQGHPGEPLTSDRKMVQKGA